MVRVPFGLGKVPDGRLLPVGVPRVLSVLHETVEHQLMLPLVI